MQAFKARKARKDRRTLRVAPARKGPKDLKASDLKAPTVLEEHKAFKAFLGRKDLKDPLGLNVDLKVLKGVPKARKASQDLPQQAWGLKALRVPKVLKVLFQENALL
jgi:hypothetical protein